MATYISVRNLNRPGQNLHMYDAIRRKRTTHVLAQLDSTRLAFPTNQAKTRDQFWYRLNIFSSMPTTDTST